MAKETFDVAVAFAPQSGEGVYDPTLDAIAANLSGDPDGTDDGLLLGDPESGVAESGLALSIGRVGRPKAYLAGSFTRSISDFLRAEVRSLAFSFPWCGSRRTTTTPVDADFQALRGVEAILGGTGLIGAAYAAGTGWHYKFGASVPFSGLLYYFGNRLELLDCRTSSLTFSYTPGSIPIATAEIAVGSIKDPSSDTIAPAALPTLDYGAQADESAAVVESIGHQWGGITRGFSSLDLVIAPEVQDIPDSNANNGVIREASGRETTINATIFADDTDAVYALKQAFADSLTDLGAWEFQVGAAAGAAEIAKAILVTAPRLELETTDPDRLGTFAVNTVTLHPRSSAANNELNMIMV